MKSRSPEETQKDLRKRLAYINKQWDAANWAIARPAAIKFIEEKIAKLPDLFAKNNTSDFEAEVNRLHGHLKDVYEADQLMSAIKIVNKMPDISSEQSKTILNLYTEINNSHFLMTHNGSSQRERNEGFKDFLLLKTDDKLKASFTNIFSTQVSYPDNIEDEKDDEKLDIKISVPAESISDHSNPTAASITNNEDVVVSPAPQSKKQINMPPIMQDAPKSISPKQQTPSSTNITHPYKKAGIFIALSIAAAAISVPCILFLGIPGLITGSVFAAISGVMLIAAALCLYKGKASLKVKAIVSSGSTTYQDVTVGMEKSSGIKASLDKEPGSSLSRTLKTENNDKPTERDIVSSDESRYKPRSKK